MASSKQTTKSKPASSNGTPRGGNGTPSAGKKAAAAGNGTPAAGNGTPARRKTTPAGGNRTPARSKTSAAAGNGGVPASKGSAVSSKGSAGTSKSSAASGKGSAAGGKGKRAVGRGKLAAGKSKPAAGKGLAASGKGQAAGSGGLAPSFAPVELTAPARTGRRLRDAEQAIETATERLQLAWALRHELDPRLPGQHAFHPRAWTAVGEIRRLREAMGLSGNAPGREEALAALALRLGLVRSIVADTTRPGDLARTRLRFELPLHHNNALVETAAAILDGAHEVQEQFPALGDDVLAAAEGALDQARQALGQGREQRHQRSLQRATSGDRLQVAIDVLLDSIDHLRAAARAAFLPARPAAAEPFLAALEPQKGPAEEDDEAAPVPAPAS